MKKSVLLLMCVILLLSFVGCTPKADNRVVIYTSAEEFRTEYFLKRLNEEFPNYDITLQYQSTGNNAAKLKA